MDKKYCNSHKWYLTGYTGKNSHWKCKKCDITYQKPLSKEQEKQYIKMMKDMFRPKKENNVHYVIHKFQKKFRKDSGYPSEYKYQGYDFILEMEKFAKKYPNDIYYSSCDDFTYSSSRLFFIEHKTKNNYHGVTVLYIPQNGQPVEFFLYEYHQKEALKILQKLFKRGKQLIKNREKIDNTNIKKLEKMFGKPKSKLESN